MIATILMLAMVLGCQKEVKPTGTITLYTSVPTAIIEELKQDFEAQNPGIYLEIYRNGTSAVVEKIKEEIAAGQIQADLIRVANFTVGEEPKEKGLLLTWTPPESAEIPDILKDATGYYYTGQLLIMVVAYNTDTVTTIPTGYKDLLDKRHQGRVGHDTPETSGSLLYFVGTLLEDADFGEEFWEALLSTQEPKIYYKTTDLANALLEDEINITGQFSIHAVYNYRVNKGIPIQGIYPEEGIPLVLNVVAILNQTDHPEEALNEKKIKD